MAPEPTSEQPLLLANLPPSRAQRRTAFAVVSVFLIAFASMMPVMHAPWVRLDAWLTFYSTSLFITDLITASLLFSQYSLVRQRPLLILAIGYLFSALIMIPYNLSAPGLHASTDLLGAGLQTTVWLYVIWRIASSVSVIFYELTKNEVEWEASAKSARLTIGISIAGVILVICALTWFVTAQHHRLPAVYVDAMHLTPLANAFAAIVFLSCAFALVLLWARGRSVLDLWLMVTVAAWLLEITLQSFFVTAQFSAGWYLARVYSLIAGSVVMIVLLSEATTLYAHVARSVIRQRAARQARQAAMDTIAASIAHEVSQPLGAIAANAEAALIYIDKLPPDLQQVRDAIQDIASASTRGKEVVSSLRAMFQRDTLGKSACDANGIIREVVDILHIDLKTKGIVVVEELRFGLPLVAGDRRQLQQVFLNLITNAIDAMGQVSNRARVVTIASELAAGSSYVVVTVKDSGEGIKDGDADHVFDPFFTTKPFGTGIGLTICRSILDAHGGELRLYANAPYGAVFEVWLPVDGFAVE